MNQYQITFVNDYTAKVRYVTIPESTLLNAAIAAEDLCENETVTAVLETPVSLRLRYPNGF